MRLALLAITFMMAFSAPAQDPNRADQFRQLVSKAAKLRGAAQTEALHRLLNKQGAADTETADLIDSLFHYEDNLRPSLRALLSDRELGSLSSMILNLIAAPEDIRFMINLPPSQRKRLEDDGAYGIVCSLLDPTSPEEWDFLRRSAWDEFGDARAERGAIQSLKLIATDESRRILLQVQRKALQQNRAEQNNTDGARMIAQALSYIESQPAPLFGSDLKRLGARVAQAAGIGGWEGNGEPFFNQARDMALVKMAFRWSHDEYVYAATFHKLDGTWKLRGLREIFQGVMPVVAPTPGLP